MNAQQLLLIVPKCPTPELYAKHLTDSMRLAQINTVLRGAGYIATLAHETDSFRSMVEYASGDAYEGNVQLGNVRKGDGRRYKGRGWPMCTGRSAYHLAGRALGLDLEEHPELAELPENAAKIGAWFWASGAGARLNLRAREYLSARYGSLEGLNLNRVIDAGDFAGVTMAVQGSANVGPPCFFERRQALFYKGLEVFGSTAALDAA